jgi:uncharacterized protein (DUF4213/DUF364 family)
MDMVRRTNTWTTSRENPASLALAPEHWATLFAHPQLDDSPIASSSVPMRGADLFVHLVKDAENHQVPLRDLSIFHRWVMVRTDRWSFAPHFCAGNLRMEESHVPEDLSPWLGWPSVDVARRMFASNSPTHRSLGLACLKATLPIPQEAEERDSFDCLAPLACQMRTLVIGPSPSARIWKSRGWRVTILEPGSDGNVEWPSHPDVRSAELVVASGSILLGGWLRDMVRHTPLAKARFLVGPTVPPSREFFRMGIHGLGFSEASDAGGLTEYFRRGGVYLRGAPVGAIRKYHWFCRPGFVKDLVMSLR